MKPKIEWPETEADRSGWSEFNELFEEACSAVDYPEFLAHAKDGIKDTVMKVSILLGEYHSKKMVDPRGSDCAVLDNVVLAYVMASRHRWEVLREGDPENLRKLLRNLTAYVERMDQEVGISDDGEIEPAPELAVT